MIGSEFFSVLSMQMCHVIVSLLQFCRELCEFDCTRQISKYRSSKLVYLNFLKLVFAKFWLFLIRQNPVDLPRLCFYLDRAFYKAWVIMNMLTQWFHLGLLLMIISPFILSGKIILDPRLSRAGSFKISLVSCMFNWRFFSKTAAAIFLVFWLALDCGRRKKVTEPKVWNKLLVGQNLGESLLLVSRLYSASY